METPEEIERDGARDRHLATVCQRCPNCGDFLPRGESVKDATEKCANPGCDVRVCATCQVVCRDCEAVVCENCSVEISGIAPVVRDEHYCYECARWELGIEEAAEAVLA